MKLTSRLIDQSRTARRPALVALWTVLSITLGAVVHAAPPAPVALVVWIAGDVKAGRSPLPLHQMVAAGETVILANGGKVALLYPQEARLWTLYGPGQVRVAAKSPTTLDKRVRLESRVLPAVYREVEVGSAYVGQGALVLRGTTPIRIAGPRLALWFEPQGELLWSSPGWAREFDVEVSKADGTIVQKHKAYQPRLQITNLQAGTAYVVRVAATDDAGRSHGDLIRFSLVEELRARELLAARPAADADEPAQAAYQVLLTAAAAAPWR